MKKTIILLALLVLFMTSLFATTDNNDVLINGIVDPIDYKFSINYQNSSIANNGFVNETFDLSKFRVTDNFYVNRSSGNSNTPISFQVEITTGFFIGNFNGNENYNTRVRPLVFFDLNNYSLQSLVYRSSREYSKLSLIIPAGANKTSTNIAAFHFILLGHENVPAGEFVSNVRINFIYNN